MSVDDLGADDWPDKDEQASRLTSRTTTVFTCTSK
jgi:hypothetical protein